MWNFNFVYQYIKIKGLSRWSVITKCDVSDRDLDDLLDLTDSESSSSSNPGIFETNQPFVLELHELKKDEPAADQVTPDTKTKKKKKRRNLPVNENKTATSSTSSVSESVPSAADAAMKEEFYDANESYHLLSGLETSL